MLPLRHRLRVIARQQAAAHEAAQSVPHGGRKFRILAIDIHTVRDGKLTGRTYHVEDWMGATRQLNGR